MLVGKLFENLPRRTPRLWWGFELLTDVIEDCLLPSEVWLLLVCYKSTDIKAASIICPHTVGSRILWNASIAGLIPQSLQLKAQVTLSSLVFVLETIKKNATTLYLCFSTWMCASPWNVNCDVSLILSLLRFEVMKEFRLEITVCVAVKLIHSRGVAVTTHPRLVPFWAFVACLF